MPALDGAYYSSYYKVLQELLHFFFESRARDFFCRPAEHQALLTLNTPSATRRLKSITGGRTGQVLYMRLSVRMEIEHGSPIRLRNTRTLTTADQLDANKMMAFICISGGGLPGHNSVWAEISRNWG